MSGEAAGPAGDVDRSPPYLSEFASVLTRSDRHRDRLAAIDVRVTVAGTRGKSTLVRWLHDELVDREYDTYAKVTGTEPLSIYNGTEWLIPRSGRTTLYENEREIRRFAPEDAIVVENQGITPYTTRLVNTRYVRPTLAVVPNVREDHLDTLGGDRERITRALARSMPEGVHVICGEQGESVRGYFATELDRRDATVTFVDVPAEFGLVPGAELVYCLDETLREVDGRGLDRSRAERYLESFAVEWRHLPDGRVFDAASVNDVQSTEAVRRALLAGSEEVVQPLVYLRRDRPGRTASYARYLELLYEQGLVEQVRVVDGHASAFDARTSVPVVAHEPSERPAAVLTAALADGWPVIVMGNATPAFMTELRDAIEERAAVPPRPGARPLETASLDAVARDAAQILVLDRAPRETTNGLCSDLLTVPSADRALIVTLARSIDVHLDEWAGRPAAETPDRLGFVGVGDASRSVASPGDSSPTGRLPEAGTVGPVTTVDDLTRLGGALAHALAELDAEAHAVSVCFDSVTRLVEDRSLEDAFRLLHVITRQLESAGATAHYHLSTADEDGQTVATLKPLFDVVITRNEEGDRWIHR